MVVPVQGQNSADPPLAIVVPEATSDKQSRRASDGHQGHEGQAQDGSNSGGRRQSYNMQTTDSATGVGTFFQEATSY